MQCNLHCGIEQLFTTSDGLTSHHQFMPLAFGHFRTKCGLWAGACTVDERSAGDLGSLRGWWGKCVLPLRMLLHSITLLHGLLFLVH